MKRLPKREVERLLNCYDKDPVGALTDALNAIFKIETRCWTDIVGRLDVAENERAALLRYDLDALDALARRLNETRLP